MRVTRHQNVARARCVTWSRPGDGWIAGKLPQKNSSSRSRIGRVVFCLPTYTAREKNKNKNKTGGPYIAAQTRCHRGVVIADGSSTA